MAGVNERHRRTPSIPCAQVVAVFVTLTGQAIVIHAHQTLWVLLFLTQACTLPSKRVAMHANRPPVMGRHIPVAGD